MNKFRMSLVFCLLVGCGGKGAVDDDGDGYTEDEDCDDSDPAIYPDATELCDGIDNDCDNEIDEEADGALPWFGDADGDGFGDASNEQLACNTPAGFVDVAGDCDDSSAQINPDAAELCDEVDNDCDGEIDEDDADDASNWYTDGDGDGFGDPNESTLACDAPPGTTAAAGDCNDSDASVHPDAVEVCNGIDDDCDGVVDPDDADDVIVWWRDSDFDGFGDPANEEIACEQPALYVGNDLDCDDSNAGISPSALEQCDNIDNDCDGQIDEDDAIDAMWWYLDADSDAYGDTATGTLTCDQPTDHVDQGGDCDDGNFDINPGADEVCNGIDDNCDGDIDEEALDAVAWYSDGDGDGYGDPATWDYACDQPTDTVADGTDCDDTDDDVNPAAVEICNNVDDNCNGDVDGDAVDGDTWYFDNDGDGYGDSGTTTDACDLPLGYAATDDDCDDDDFWTNPSAPEVCDLADNDCDGVIDNDVWVLGGGPDCAAESCEQIIYERPSAGDDTYWVNGGGMVAFEVGCDMTADGGGWTQLTGEYLATRSAGTTREYLYSYGTGWYASPLTTELWNWSSYTVVEGSYRYGDTVSGVSGAFSCTDVEAGHWGIGCSNNPGPYEKVLPWDSGGTRKDEVNGESQICQDVPNILGPGPCVAGTQIWIRP